MSSLHGRSECRFLALPLELRLQIYQHLLSTSDQIVTFSCARLEGSRESISQRLHHDGRSPLAGLPRGHIPIVMDSYDESLLRISPAATMADTTPVRPEEQGRCPYSPTPSILMTNRQIRAEVLQHFPAAKNQPVNIFLSYPYGLHVFDTIGSHLTPSAQSVQIAGEYVSNTFDPARAAARYSIKLLQSAEQQASGHIAAQPDSSEQLGRLVSKILGLDPQPVELHMRIYYPGANSYNVVWGDSGSPIVIALQSICAGEIQLEVWRESNATAVYLAARPSKNGKRTVRTVWRHFDDPRFAGKEPLVWEIDAEWPKVRWQVDFGR